MKSHKVYIGFAVFVFYTMRAMLQNEWVEEAMRLLERLLSNAAQADSDSLCAGNVSVLFAIVSSVGSPRVFGQLPNDWQQIALTGQTLAWGSRNFLSGQQKKKPKTENLFNESVLSAAVPLRSALAREWAVLDWLDRACPEAKFVVRIDDNKNNVLVNVNVLNATLQHYSKLKKNEENFWVVKGPLQVYSRSTIRQLLPPRRHNSRQLISNRSGAAGATSEAESLLAPETAEFVALGRGLCNLAFETDREKHSQTLESWKLCEQTNNQQDKALSLLDLVKLGTGGSYRWGDAYQAGGANPSWGRDTVYGSFSNLSWPGAAFEFKVSHPHVSCDDKDIIKGLVLVPSAPSHGEQRNFLRIYNRPPKGWRRIFLLGNPVHVTEEEEGEGGVMTRCWEGAAACPIDLGLAQEIEDESRKFDDIVIGNFIDTYQTLPLKTVAMLDWALTRCTNAKMLFKVDDDRFVNYVVLDDTVRSYEDDDDDDNNDNIVQLWIGNITTYKALRPESGYKTVVSVEEFPGPNYPLYMSGSYYGMSMDTAEVFRHMARRVQFMPIEDVFIGLVALFSGVEPESFTFVVQNSNCSTAFWESKQEFQRARVKCFPEDLL